MSIHTDISELFAKRREQQAESLHRAMVVAKWSRIVQTSALVAIAVALWVKR